MDQSRFRLLKPDHQENEPRAGQERELDTSWPGHELAWTRAGLDANGLRLEMRAADRQTGAVAVGIAIASGSDANGKLCCLERELSWIKMELGSSRIRNALGLELIRWIRAGTDAGTD
ncbi:hypothetical protein F2Q70_00010944 [Brassica cretica]|uniref:Uncharacterized protein n=1 Tax=Brassica cretica TaxID=69181 RepID=A0A8S9LRJ9_BRACR|nr:hypothetical protein F2Q70_00010944 [Brassica cretica]